MNPFLCFRSFLSSTGLLIKKQLFQNGLLLSIIFVLKIVSLFGYPYFGDHPISTKACGVNPRSSFLSEGIFSADLM